MYGVNLKVGEAGRGDTVVRECMASQSESWGGWEGRVVRECMASNSQLSP